MVTVKEAVVKAIEFGRDLLGASEFRLEEVRKSGLQEDAWLITLSIPNPSGLSFIQGNDRLYKVFTVNRETGEVESMEIREPAHGRA